MTTFPIHGTVAPGFEPLRAVFERNFTDDVEVGASFAATVDGEFVADLWGGFQDRGCTREWRADTLVNVYSTTKGIASLALAALVEDGRLDYDAPVADYWPEFRAGAGGLTVGQFLSHQSGVCGLRARVTVEDLYDFPAMAARIAAEEPHWEPGSAAGYHAILWGFLAGEIALRITGRSLGALLRERVAGPLGADFHLGLPESEHRRVADLIGPNHARRQPDPRAMMGVKMPPLFPFALQNPSVRPWKDACSAEWRRAEIAAANGHGNGRAIAGIYGAAASGGLLRDETLAALTREEWGMEDDLVLGRPMRRGRGVNLNTDGQYGPNPSSFGHNGAGGSIGFADPARRLGVGYAMNQMEPGIDADTRGARLVRALFDCLG